MKTTGEGMGKNKKEKDKDKKCYIGIKYILRQQ